MASYLWRRGPTWFFQLRPPHDLQHLLGATPLRIRLPARTSGEASSFARQLAGKADKEFAAMRYAGLTKLKIASEKPERDWTDDDIEYIRQTTRKAVLDTLSAEIAELKSLNAQYQSLEKQKAGRAPEDQLQLAEAQKHVFANTVDAWARFAKLLAEEHSEAVSDLRTRSLTFRLHYNDLSVAQRSAYDLQEKARDLEKENRQIDLARQEAVETNAMALGQVTRTLGTITELGDAVTNKGPKLSECMEQFIEAKANQLGNDSLEIEYFRRRIDAFIAIIGDKEVGAYHIGHLGDFATKLSFLPKDYALDRQKKRKSKAELSRKSRAQWLLRAIKTNEDKTDEPRDTSISYKTIKVNYVGKIKTVIRWLCARHKVAYPFVYDKIFVPKEAPTSTIRFGLDARSLRKLFAKATSRCEHKRPEDVWLPLVGYLTGARLSELVYLQPDNIKKHHDVWIMDLTGQIQDAKGKRNRAIKNRESQRIIALHNELVRLGFVDWAREQGELGHDYVFPRLHDGVKRPGHAASKRFQRLFDALRKEDVKSLGKKNPNKFGNHVFHHYDIAARTGCALTKSRNVPSRYRRGIPSTVLHFSTVPRSCATTNCEELPICPCWRI
jgi:integrase